jgi:hypothetical protein
LNKEIVFVIKMGIFCFVNLIPNSSVVVVAAAAALLISFTFSVRASTEETGF